MSRVVREELQAGAVLHGVNSQREELCHGFGVFHQQRRVFVHQCHGVVCLVIFGHIGRRHEDRGLAQQAQFADARCTGTADHQIGHGIGRSHVGDKLRHVEVFRTTLGLQALGNFLAVKLTRLPQKLKVMLPLNQR